MRVVTESLDDSFELVIASAAPADRPMLRALPGRIGISKRAVGGWDDYSKLEPMRSLPVFAADLCGNATDATVSRFVLAHRAAGFVGLVVDRIADKQTTKDHELARAVRILVRCWIDRLVDATSGPRGEVTASVQAALRGYARGLRDERVYGRTGLPDAGCYAAYVANKTDWLALASRWMLFSERCGEHVESFQVCFESLLLGLQLADDALDADEDRALRGTSVPDQLDVASTSMLIAAERILRETETEARRVGLASLADFCGAYAHEMRSALPVDHPIAALGAVFLLAEMTGEKLPESQPEEHAIIRGCESGAFELAASPMSPAPSWQPVS